MNFFAGINTTKIIYNNCFNSFIQLSIFSSAEENPRKKSKTASSKLSMATSLVLTEEDIDTQNNIFTFGKASVKKLTNRDIFLMKEAFLAQERRGTLNIKVALLTPEAAPATREDIQWLFEKRAEALRGVQLYIDEQFQIFIFKCPDSAHYINSNRCWYLDENSSCGPIPRCSS